MQFPHFFLMPWVSLLPLLDLVKNPITFFSLFLIPPLLSLSISALAPSLTPSRFKYLKKKYGMMRSKDWRRSIIFPDKVNQGSPNPSRPSLIYEIKSTDFRLPNFLIMTCWMCCMYSTYMFNWCTIQVTKFCRLTGWVIHHNKYTSTWTLDSPKPTLPSNLPYDWSLHMARLPESRGLMVLNRSHNLVRRSEMSSHTLWFLSLGVAQEGRNLLIPS